jgi:hypothetical protein
VLQEVLFEYSRGSLLLLLFLFIRELVSDCGLFFLAPRAVALSGRIVLMMNRRHRLNVRVHHWNKSELGLRRSLRHHHLPSIHNLHKELWDTIVSDHGLGSIVILIVVERGS